MSAPETPPPPPNENVGPVLVGITATLLFFGLLVGLLRLYVRRSLRSLGSDDYTMAITLVFATTRFILQAVQVACFGNGRHKVHVAPDRYAANNRVGWVSQIFLFAGMCFLKCSIMLLLLRVKSTRALRVLLYIAMLGLVVTNFGVIVILLSECDGRPDQDCPEPRLRVHFIYATIAYSILTDLLCSLLPLVVMWKVTFPLKKKLMIWGLMSMGLLATGFAFARVMSFTLETDDLTWDYAISAIWTNIEFYLGILAANLAVSRMIYAYFFHTTGRPRPSKNTSSASSARIHSGVTSPISTQWYDRFVV